MVAAVVCCWWWQWCVEILACCQHYNTGLQERGISYVTVFKPTPHGYTPLGLTHTHRLGQTVKGRYVSLDALTRLTEGGLGYQEEVAVAALQKVCVCVL